MTGGLRLERVERSALRPVESYSDFTVFQTDAWLAFLTASQGGEPVFAKVTAEGQAVGRFTGFMTGRYGLKLLGAPMPGWTTAYMGFNLDEGIDRRAALAALKEHAFREFGCIHFELQDRRISAADAEGAALRYRPTMGFKIDLTQSEEALFAAMDPAARRCVRKAEKSGVVVEQVTDPGFAHEYYEQLIDVFAKQHLSPTYPESRVASLVEHVLPSGNLLLLRARDPDGNCIATAIFPGANDLMYFWGGASWRSGQPFRPNEAIQWAAMRYWKARGVTTYDMGGGGEYKRKYGGEEMHGAWLRHSKYGFLESLRNSAKKAYRLQQRARGLTRS
jgi:hypothetical protein